MLRACFEQLYTPDGYDGKYFRRAFPRQAKDHPCHVHVVGQMLVAAGVARPDGNRYRMSCKQ
jgi:hypothetical protein